MQYDETDFRPPLPGGAVPPDGTGAAGTAPGVPPEATGVSTIVTSPGGRPTDSVDVDPYDVITPNQEALYRPGVGREAISGVGGIGQTGAGQGRVTGPSHPNTGNSTGQPQ